jgi:hypothetical protein
MNVTLKDPESDTVVNNIIDDSGTSQIGGANLVKGNMGTFFLLVEGPEEGWTVWIYQDFRSTKFRLVHRPNPANHAAIGKQLASRYILRFI